MAQVPSASHRWDRRVSAGNNAESFRNKQQQKPAATSLMENEEWKGGNDRRNLPHIWFICKRVEILCL